MRKTKKKVVVVELRLRRACYSVSTSTAGCKLVGALVLEHSKLNLWSQKYDVWVLCRGIEDALANISVLWKWSFVASPPKSKKVAIKRSCHNQYLRPVLLMLLRAGA